MIRSFLSHTFLLVATCVICLSGHTQVEISAKPLSKDEQLADNDSESSGERDPFSNHVLSTPTWLEVNGIILISFVGAFVAFLVNHSWKKREFTHTLVLGLDEHVGYKLGSQMLDYPNRWIYVPADFLKFPKEAVEAHSELAADEGGIFYEHSWDKFAHRLRVKEGDTALDTADIVVRHAIDNVFWKSESLLNWGDTGALDNNIVLYIIPRWIEVMVRIDRRLNEPVFRTWAEHWGYLRTGRLYDGILKRILSTPEAGQVGYSLDWKMSATDANRTNTCLSERRPE